MIITLSGKAECGKDFCSSIMKEYLEELGHKTMIIHQADYLKYICKTYFGWDGQKDEKGRALLQYVGTDLVRSKYPNYWVESTLRAILILRDMYEFFLIPDTRFPNEITLMKFDYSVQSVLVTRPNHINKLTPEQRLHASETALDNFQFDYTIVGGEGRDGAYQPTINVVSEILERAYLL